MHRRNFTAMMATATTGYLLSPLLVKGAVLNTSNQIKDIGLPPNLPENIKVMIRKVLSNDFKSLNTDWFGSIQIEGLLRFANRGFKEGYDFAVNWFDYHVEHDGKLTDQEYYDQYEGKDARVLRGGPLTFAIYSAILGVAFPVHELYKINKSETARTVCLDVADAILHYAARDRFGMLAHDDFNFTDFAIPDTAYWATRANAIAASLCKDKALAAVYWKQAIYQLEQGITYFLDKEKGIVRTGLFKGEPSKTYWCRSQGWLLWAIAGLLRYLPKSHPSFNSTAKSMQLIADGIKKYQSANGALHVLVDDPSTPEEVTGTCMALSALKEAVRNGWIPNQYEDMLQKAWSFIKLSVDKDGNIHNVYTGWAVPAENRLINRMDERFAGYVPGIIMLAADEMTR